MIPGPRGRSHPVLDDWSGGLNTSANPFKVTFNSSPRCYNVYSQAKSRKLFKRNGDTQLTTAAAGSSETQGNALFDYGPNLATGRKLIAHIGTRIFKMDDQDGVLDEIGTGFNNARSQIVPYSAVNVDYVIIADGIKPLQSWNGVDASVSAVASAPVGRLPFAFRNRLLSAGNVGDPKGRIRYTEEDSLSFGNNTFDCPGVQEDPTAWSELRGVAYIFFPHEIWRITFLGGVPLYEVKRIVFGIGTNSPATIQNIIWQGTEYIVFLGTDKVFYLFDGFNISQISQNIDTDNGISDYSLELLNDEIKDAHSVKHTTRQWYVTYAPNGATTRPNMSWVLDYSGQTLVWWPFSNQNFGASTEAIDSLKHKVIVTAGYDGHLYYWDRGKNDHGTVVQAAWQTHKMFPVGGDALIKGGEIKCYASRRANANISLYVRTNLNTAWGTAKPIRLYAVGDAFLGTTFVLGSSRLGSLDNPTDVFKIDNVFSHIEFKLEDSGLNLLPWSFNKFEFYGFALGTGRSQEEANSP